MEKKLLEQDLEPIQDEVPEDSAPIDSDLDLEEFSDEAEEMGENDYQYVLTVEQEDAEDGQNLEPEFTFLLTPKEAAEEEGNDELEQIEDTSADIEGAQAPEASVAPAPAAPLPESVWSDLEPLTEQGEGAIMPAGGENTPPPPPADAAPAPVEEPLPEGEPELEEVEPIRLSAEDIKGFLESGDVELKFSIDEETEFSIEEAIDYLKLYPDSEIYVTVKSDLAEFKEKLDEFLAGKEEGEVEAATETQNVEVDNEGESLDLKNTPQANPATPQPQQESFSIFNIRGKKNLPDGIYIGHLAENKLYGRIDVKLTASKLVIDKDVFELKENLDIAEAKDKETIGLVLNENEVEKLVKVLEEKADIRV
ncbi:MAG: hypothetical protein WC495_07160, partial [Patescibacteria group bacterium]